MFNRVFLVFMFVVFKSCDPGFAAAFVFTGKNDFLTPEQELCPTEKSLLNCEVRLMR